MELTSNEEEMDKLLDQMEGILKQAMQYMVEVFKDLKAKSLSCPEKEEELAEEAGCGDGETMITESIGGGMGSTEMVATTPAAQ